MAERTTTDEISEWINNDSDYFDVAREYAMAGALSELQGYLLGIIRSASYNTAPGHVAYHCSPYGLEHDVNWREVARHLVGDDVNELGPEAREKLNYK